MTLRKEFLLRLKILVKWLCLLQLKLNKKTVIPRESDLPVEIWQRSGEFTFKYNSTSPVDSVIVDPDKILPDFNYDNNILIPGNESSK